jgi:ATP-dependent DNA helicase PIF1
MKLDTGTELPDNLELTKEFTDTFDLINNTNTNLFITGKAGSGKSTLLEYFRQNTEKKFVTLAFQGITAIKAKGQTLHSFFKFPPHFVTKQDVKILKDKSLIKKLDTILIDEISLVRADLFDAIDISLKLNRGNDEPFGGVQIIVFGDVMQLDPIIGRQDVEIMEKFYPEGVYFFNANCFTEGKLKNIELTKIFRQKDQSFIDLLNNIRTGSVDEKKLSFLNKRITTMDNLPKETIILAPTNKKVDDINFSHLYQLKTPTFNYDAIVKGIFKEKEFPVDKNLRLKVGAQIMITKNDTEFPRKWVNGTLGIIQSLSEDKIQILIDDKSYYLGKTKWDKYEYRFNGNQVDTSIKGSFIQYPIKLAWATTIHKSQGQTFEKVAIDLDTGAFAHGQTYVALSRAKSLEGIFLLNKINRKDIIFDKKVLDFVNNKSIVKKVSKIKDHETIKIEELNGWSTRDDNKLISLYKRNVPEIALSKMFKKKISEVRDRIIYLMKKSSLDK